MKIYTRKGDKGISYIGKNIQIDKANPVLEFLGEMDELQIRIGSIGAWHRSFSDKTNSKRKQNLNYKSIEKELLFLKELIQQIYELNSIIYQYLIDKDHDIAFNFDKYKDFIKIIENHIDHMENTLPTIHDFIISDENYLHNLIHLARTQTRKSERSAQYLKKTKLDATVLFQFLNRLSDYFFTLARWILMDSEKPDQTIKR